MKYQVKLLDGTARQPKIVKTGKISPQLFEYVAVDAYPNLEGEFQGYRIVSVAMYGDGDVDIYVRKES